ncbi:MAG: STAS/SEC14 domain-containing protein [Chitinivibrionales bacterium]|nr:STAS/SEC14 domain-containing protein [Chitinivibrionales bacterium]
MDDKTPVTMQVRLDEELQIIRQVITGRLNEEDARLLFVQTEACVNRLKNPEKVRVLVDGSRLGKSNSRTRKRLFNETKRPNLKRLALFGGSPMVRTFLKFFNIISGNDKMNCFKTEAEALAWLLE